MSEPRRCREETRLKAPPLLSMTPPIKYSFHPKEAAFHLARAAFLFSEEVHALTNAYSKLQEKWTAVNQEMTQKFSQLTHQLHLILKQVSQGILWIRLDGTVQLINETAQKLLHISDDAIGKKIDGILPVDALGFSIKEAIYFGLAPKSLSKTYRDKLLEISTTFFYEGPKSEHGLLILLKDSSELSQLQLASFRNDRLSKLGEMVATIAHEIRNPLGGIRGYAALLVRDLKDSPHLQEMAKFVIEGTHNLETLVTTVLQYARPVQMQIESVELGQFFRNLVKFVKVDPAFPENVKLDLHLPFRALAVSIDPKAMRSALLNLIFNGFQAMPNGGHLTIALMKQESSCQIEITDTGIGMDEEALSRLFSLFYTTKQKGNGLGLVEVQKIIQAHLGSIQVRSSVKRGTTFTITLPLTR